MCPRARQKPLISTRQPVKQLESEQLESAKNDRARMGLGTCAMFVGLGTLQYDGFKNYFP